MEDTDNLQDAGTETDVIDNDDQTNLDTDDLDDSPDDDQGSDDSADDDDSEEIEYEGKKHRIPRDLRDAFLRQSDYTRKTQDLAQIRKDLESTLERVNTASEEESRAFAKVAGLDAQIAQYEQYDLNAWAQQDPAGAQNARLQLLELRQARDHAAQEYGQAREQTRSVAQQVAAKRLEEGQRTLAQKIPGWGADKARAIRDFAIDAYGLSPDYLDKIEDPAIVLALHDAMEGRKASKQAANRAKVEKQQEITPAKTVKGSGAGVIKGLDDRLSIEEWVKRRNAQVAKR